MPTIRIDDDVYSWLKSQAIPFEDTPNSVLRKIAGLDQKQDTAYEEEGEKMNQITKPIMKDRLISGKYLNELWKVGARHALYHKDGTFYENLEDFPGALFDYNGYIIFNTKGEYNSSRYLEIGQKLNVHRGISTIPGYKRMR